MFKRASAVSAFLLAVLVAGILLAPPQPAVSQTTTLVLKGQSSHPASSNLHLIFKLFAETVDKMSAGRLKI